MYAFGPLSPTGQAVINFYADPDTGTGFTYWQMASILRVIFESLCMRQNKWSEMTFDVSMKNEKLCSGSFFQLDAPAGIGRRIA